VKEGGVEVGQEEVEVKWDERRWRPRGEAHLADWAQVRVVCRCSGDGIVVLVEWQWSVWLNPQP
jgi:hypothetical protein